MIEKWNHLDLFSGIGGFSLAAKMAGWEFASTLYSDVDDYANRVYAKNFPDATPIGDVKRIRGRELRKRYEGKWLLTGGFPCQDLSAGNHTGKGLSGERSGLFFQVLRIIHELQPEKVLLENVEALRRKGLEFIIRSIASCGYIVEWGILSAAAVNAPHLRQRCWIAAYPDPHVWCDDTGSLPAEDAGMGDLHQPARPTVLDRVRRAREDQHQTFWDETVSTSRLCRVDDGLPVELDESLKAKIEALPLLPKSEVQCRVAALGNAIVPECAKLFLEAMLPKCLAA